MAAVHMDPAEAVQAHIVLGASRSIGMRFGTFQLTDEAIDAPLHALDEASRRAGLGEAFGALDFGETRECPLELCNPERNGHHRANGPSREAVP